MTRLWFDLASQRQGAWLIATGTVVLIAVVQALRISMKKRPTPDDLERRRRDSINRNGKLGDGEILDIHGTAIIFSYEIAGVGYTASQDLSALESLLPEGPASLIGPVSVKFDPRNPANSIVVCEHWSGLHDRRTQTRLA
jgi:hypothetical protein